jgi:hypothetical protein
MFRPEVGDPTVNAREPTVPAVNVKYYEKNERRYNFLSIDIDIIIVNFDTEDTSGYLPKYMA